MAPAERVDLALACLAVDHRLGGVLLVGLPPALLPLLGRRLGAMLADDRDAAEVVSLGASQGDDDLWWVSRPVGAEGKFQFGMVPGPLVDAPGGPPRTVIIPDLARASLAVARAAVTVIGSDAAVADRHGQHASWQPRTRWLAACARSGLSRLSPHLLDRFCVRVDASDLPHAGWGHNAILAALDRGDGGADWDEAVLRFPPPPVTGQWWATPRLPHMTGEAVETVLAIVGGTVGAGPTSVRRDLALARMARALAMLSANDAVRGEHVLDAAAIMGLALANPRDAVGSSPQAPSPSVAADDPGAGTQKADVPRSAAAATTVVDGAADQGAMAGNEPTVPALLDPAMPGDLLQQGPYPEDDPSAIAEYASLRETWQPGRRPRATRGHIIGTEPTRCLSDIAVVPTAFEAAKFQALRRERDPRMRSGLIIFGSDLRRYRYLPRPDTAVVLVLDHTCRREWDFGPPLAPYLRWAYVRRALISVVEFGYRGAADELRATAYRAASVLDRRVAVSLGRVSGRATPLAHALDMAVQEMRRHLRQAEVVADNSWLIVVSDGRGNVPLEASQRGLIPGIVAREGVTDMLRAAQAARALPGVRKVVLAPPKLTHYARLPFDLADAMGGIVVEDAP
jgi:magnesium chelatase subunit D